MRQKVLSLALTRALKDPFPPARLHAVRAMVGVKNLFTPQEMAARLLPALSPTLLDSEKDVRDEVRAPVII